MSINWITIPTEDSMHYQFIAPDPDTEMPDGEPTDNFTDTDPAFPAPANPANTRSIASRLKAGAEGALTVLFLLAILCCRNDALVDYLFYGILGAGGLWLYASALEWIGRRMR